MALNSCRSRSTDTGDVQPRLTRQGRAIDDQLTPIATADVGGVPIAITSMAAAVEWLHDWSLRGRGGIAVRLVNAFSIVSMHENPDYLTAARTSGVSLPDGTPVMLALRLLRRHHGAGRVRGPSFFVRSLARSEHSGVREFFLGTDDLTLDRLTAVVERRWPGIAVHGRFAPPLTRTIDDAFVEACRAQVAASGADRVWVALGTPKQDLLAERLSQALGVPCVAVGAAFDFLAGSKREAPRLFQWLGVEWIFRFAAEPRRLWRRYLVGNLRFVMLVLRLGR